MRPEHGWTRRRVVFLSISGTLAVCLLWATREVLLPFILALIIAYVLTPLVGRLERYRVPRAAAILSVYALVLGTLYGAGAALAPRLYSETTRFLREAPVMADKLADRWGPRLEGWVDGLRKRSGGSEHSDVVSEQRPMSPIEISQSGDGGYHVEVGTGLELVQVATDRWQLVPVEPSSGLGGGGLVAEVIDKSLRYIGRNTLQLVRFGQQVIAVISHAIFLAFMTLMVAGYLMYTRERILGFFRSLVPESTGQRFDRLVWRLERGLAGVVRGQLLICLVNGVLSAIGFWIFDLKYWPVMAILAGVMSLIPIFGSILSSVPAVAVGLTQDLWTGVWILLWILGIHQLEANFLNPKIIGDAARIHPVLVVFSLFVGERFFGIWGALLAVPTLSVVQSLFIHFRVEVVASPAERALLLSPSERPPDSGSAGPPQAGG